MLKWNGISFYFRKREVAWERPINISTFCLWADFTNVLQKFLSGNQTQSLCLLQRSHLLNLKLLSMRSSVVRNSDFKNKITYKNCL
jgi:hypothetical protein